MFGKLFAKHNKKGFTLMEMLIVVAIIAILVAVSIPIFTSQLEKSREATDQANFRAAKAAAVTAYLSDELGAKGETAMWYDAVDGTLTTAANKAVPAADAGYGKGTAGGTDKHDYEGDYITVTYSPPTATADATITLAWAANADTAVSTATVPNLYQVINIDDMS